VSSLLDDRSSNTEWPNMAEVIVLWFLGSGTLVGLVVVLAQGI
jgi:hypothetical protein